MTTAFISRVPKGLSQEVYIPGDVVESEPHGHSSLRKSLPGFAPFSSNSSICLRNLCLFFVSFLMEMYVYVIWSSVERSGGRSSLEKSPAPGTYLLPDEILKVLMPHKYILRNSLAHFSFLKYLETTHRRVL